MRRSLLSLIVSVPGLVPGVAMAQLPEGEPSEQPAADPPPSPVADPGGGMPALPPASPVAPEPPRTVQPEVAPADRPPPEGLRLMLSDLTVLRLNPLGLETRARFGLQKRLYRSDKENMHDRLGLFAAYTLADAGPSTFNKPTVIVIASWYLSHRWRTGEPGMLPSDARPEDYTTRAFPYLLIGFAFESDLLAIN